MALETATYINDLVATNPTGGDPKSQGDDHIRLLKSTIKTTFPNVAGAVTASHTALNYTSGVTSPIQAQLNGKQAAAANLTTLSALSSSGLVVRTGVGVMEARTLVAGQGISITNPSGEAGNPKISVDLSFGTGDVTGPAGATNGHAVVFDGSTGKVIKSLGGAPVNKDGDNMLGSLSMISGAENKPGYTFTGDDDTGIWSPSANNLAISTGGVSRVLVHSSGGVGFGASASDVAPTGSEKRIFAKADNGPVLMYMSNGGSDLGLNPVSDAVGVLSFHAPSFAATTGGLLASVRGRVEGTTANDRGGRLEFVTKPNGSFFLITRMCITEAGDVGIGVASPSSTSGQTTLHIRGDSSRSTLYMDHGQTVADGLGVSAGAVVFGSTESVSAATEKRIAAIEAVTDGATANNRGGAITFTTKANGADTLTEVARIDSAGRFGLGAASNGARLKVTGSDFLGAAISQDRSGVGVWSTIVNASGGFLWRQGDITSGTDRLLIDQNGNVLSVGSGGIGYGAGSGGAVTQITSRTTGVTLNKPSGSITLVSAAGSTSWQSFTLTNSAINSIDSVVVVQRSGTDLYEIHVTAVAAGSCRISFRTTGGTTTEQPVFNFAVIKGATS